jgi:hypothetical protein
MDSLANSMNHAPVNNIDINYNNNIINNQIVSENLSAMDNAIPVAIIIFDNGGVINYRAYSPTVWRADIDRGADDAEDQYGQFLARIYQQLAFNPTQPMNTATVFGNMNEVHTRWHHTQLAQREGGNCYFTTYIHPYTPYKPVHRRSPVFFNVQQGANDYAAAAPGAAELFHFICPHEFV